MRVAVPIAIRLAAALAVVAVPAAAARGQSAPPTPASSTSSSTSLAAVPIDDRPAVQVREVERGLSLGTEAGGLVLFGPRAQSGSGASLGRTFGLTLGVDLGDRAGLALQLLGNSIDTPAHFVSPTQMTGSFSAFSAAALVRFAPAVAADANGVARLFWWVRGGGGVGTMSPKSFYDRPDLLLLAGTGIEYFTHLRHFSVGIDGDFLFGPRNLGPGLRLAPYLRYTF